MRYNALKPAYLLLQGLITDFFLIKKELVKRKRNYIVREGQHPIKELKQEWTIR